MKSYLKKIQIFLILIVCSLFFNYCINDEDEEPDIIPGEKLFDLYIGAEFSTCINKYGEPDFVDSTTFSDIFLIRYSNPKFSLTVFDFEDNNLLDDLDQIIAIDIYNSTNWHGTTKLGNGIGSSRTSIINEFGPCDQPASNEYVCLYSTLGVAWFFFNNEEQCQQVNVFR